MTKGELIAEQALKLTPPQTGPAEVLFGHCNEPLTLGVPAWHLARLRRWLAEVIDDVLDDERSANWRDD